MEQEDQVAELRASIQNLQIEIQAMKEELKPAIEIWITLRGFARTLYYFGKFLKWLAISVAPLGTLYIYFFGSGK